MGPFHSQVIAVFAKWAAFLDVSLPLILIMSQLRVTEDMLIGKR